MKTHQHWLPVAVLAGLLASGCGGGGHNAPPFIIGGTAPPPVGTPPPATAAPLACDDTLKANFKPDANTSVVAVRSFKKGDPLLLSGSATSTTAMAANDVCMVKLNVGPGNAGPDGAPSTSPGIGIEIWLPSKTAWNSRVHALGGGGWQGGPAGSATAIASTAAADVAGKEGAVSSTTDTGHASLAGGSFAMNPDGTINQTLWTEFFTNRDWPLTAAIAVAMLLLIVLPTLLFEYVENRRVAREAQS